jgi:co-chaperonin GroES (HSP10)
MNVERNYKMTIEKTTTETPSIGLKPIKSSLIVEVIKKDLVSKGGIVLAQSDREEVSRGRILAIGPDVTIVEVGQVILPNWQKAQKVKHEMVEYWIVKEEDLVLVFEGE